MKRLLYGVILPSGGISSSASLIIAFIKALPIVNDIELSDSEYIYTAKRTEFEQFDVEGDSAFYQASSGFPICNHTECVSQHKLGYAQGILKSGVPFEAELWKNEVSVNISVVIPELFYVSDKKSNPLKIDNLLGFHNQVESIHNGVLTIGMVDGGISTEFDVTMRYVDYLKDYGLVKFVCDMENGAVFYVTDIEGKDLVYITITLSENGEEFAKTSLDFMNFPNQPIKRTISIVK